MSFVTTMLQLQLELFLLMVLGFFCKKRGMINEHAQKSLSDILIYVILPCNILHSFSSGIHVSSALIQNCALAFVISLGLQVIATYGGKAMFRSYPQEKACVAHYGMIVSNSSFIGIPVNECIYGNIGVLYTAMYQIPLRFTMWSAGLSLFTSVKRKEVIRKVATHPCILACLAGFVLMILQIKLPGALGSAVLDLSKCTGPISMIVIGSILGDADTRELFTKDVLIFCFYRLAAFPLCVWAALSMWHLNKTLIGVTVLLSAMPAGSTTAILPEKYGANAAYGAALIFASSLLSVLTLPLFGFLLG